LVFATDVNQAIISATCMARRPNVSDFSVGLYCSLSNGTASKNRLVTCASKVSSCKISFAMAIYFFFQKYTNKNASAF
jgi:hypothetical protein